MDLIESHLAGEGPAVFMFAGEPGIGKSRLLREAIGRGEARERLEEALAIFARLGAREDTARVEGLVARL